ncbi:MAG: DinB family protein [Actinomycetota bacterium]
MSEDRSCVEQNTRERERLRALVERLDEDDLRRAVNEHWTVAAAFGHIAFWDARVLALADKLERGVPFSPSDAEPEDVDWINDASRALIHAVPCAVLAPRAHDPDSEKPPLSRGSLRSPNGIRTRVSTVRG